MEIKAIIKLEDVHLAQANNLKKKNQVILRIRKILVRDKGNILIKENI